MQCFAWNEDGDALNGWATQEYSGATQNSSISPTAETTTLKVFDLLGRQVSSVVISDGTGFWNGTDYSGEKLPAGVYTVVCAPNVFHRFSLLN